MMTAKGSMACEWCGEEVGHDESVPCSGHVEGYVRDATGRRHFACMHHVSFVKARAGNGEWQHLAVSVGARPR
jgi:hypothetical protein